MQWFRRSLIAGFFVTVPLVVSVVTLVWVFQAVDGFVDGFTGPLVTRWLGRELPGLGLLVTVIGLLVVGAVATNVLGRRLLERTQQYLLRIPVFRTVYAPVRQLMAAFSPDNESSFKRVVLVEDPERGFMLGFLTKEFTLDRGHGPEQLLAIYVPTNHLYLGDVRIYPRTNAVFPDVTVQEGIRIFLTGGMSVADFVRAEQSPAEVEAVEPDARARGRR